MAAGVTYIFSDGTVILSSQVNQDFADLVNYLNALVIPTVPISIGQGGTGATSVAAALTNLGVANLSIIPATASISGTVITLTRSATTTPTVGLNGLGVNFAFNVPANASGPFTLLDGTDSLPALPLLDSPGFSATAALQAAQFCIVSFSPAANGAAGGWVLVNPPPPGASSSVPPGAVFWFPTNTVPAGYLECNGAAVSRSTYAALNAVAAAISYGAPFGVGDGSTTFNLPDLRGYFLRAWDDSAGVDPGRTIGSIQADAVIAHTHTINLNTGGQGATNAGNTAQQVGTNSTTNGQSPAGGTETRPKNVALMPVIKT